MALALADLKAHCNVTANTDDALLTRLLAAATAHIERLLGFKLDDTTALPDGAPADLELAVLMLGADWYENREASLVGVTAQPIPFGVEQIVNEHRNYTYGLADNGWRWRHRAAQGPTGGYSGRGSQGGSTGPDQAG